MNAIEPTNTTPMSRRPRRPTPFADRMESVRAGAVAAAAALLTTMTMAAIATVAPVDWFAEISLPTSFALAETRPWLRLGFSAATGFVFGITYRYAVRSDPTNPHLKSGAIGAFALTRIFAAVERMPFDPIAIAVAAVAAALPLVVAGTFLEMTVLRGAADTLGNAGPGNWTRPFDREP